mgnify:CR=1 FL=1
MITALVLLWLHQKGLCHFWHRNTKEERDIFGEALQGTNRQGLLGNCPFVDRAMLWFYPLVQK